MAHGEHIRERMRFDHVVSMVTVRFAHSGSRAMVLMPRAPTPATRGSRVEAACTRQPTATAQRRAAEVELAAPPTTSSKVASTVCRHHRADADHRLERRRGPGSEGGDGEAGRERREHERGRRAEHGGLVHGDGRAEAEADEQRDEKDAQDCDVARTSGTFFAEAGRRSACSSLARVARPEEVRADDAAPRACARRRRSAERSAQNHAARRRRFRTLAHALLYLNIQLRRRALLRR
eukprot:6523808-Prymnesium_polylepis.1